MEATPAVAANAEEAPRYSRAWMIARLRAVLMFAREAFLRRINYLVIIPLVIGCVAFPNLVSEFGFGVFFRKSFQEIIGPAMLVAALVSTGLAWGKTRHRYFAWLALLLFGLANREFHYEIADQPVAVILLVVSSAAALWYFFTSFEKLEPWISNRVIVSCFFATIACYSVSQGLDNNLFPFALKKRAWASHTEECIETLGHIYLLASVWLCGWMRAPKS